MKIHRFIAVVKQEGKNYFIDKPDIVFQMHTVLKLKSGETIIVTDGKGREEKFEIVTIRKTQVEVKKLETVKKDVGNRLPLHAYVAILKKDNFELAVQKMTELGITDITPVLSDRTVKTGYNKERLEKIIAEAVEQSGQSILPILHTEMTLEDAVEDVAIRQYVGLVFDEPDILETPPSLTQKPVSFFIGPEGGWTEKERQFFRENNIYAVSLGNTTLRGETAAIVGTFWIKERQK